MQAAYEPIIAELHRRSIGTYFQNPDTLVVSRQHGPAMPFSDNSFWITHHLDRWYISTWSPTCYEVPHDSDLVSLCEEFVDRGCCAQVAVHKDLVEKYRLAELSDEDFDRLFGSDEPE